MGARAAGTGGALAPFDAISPVNPASVSEWIHSVIFFHAEPEFRSTSAGGPSSSTRETRFPLVGGGARLSSKFAAGLTLSTYLDRTWETTATGTDTVGGTPVALSRRFASAGAINDLRFALAWTPNAKLRLGAGMHVYTGENRLAISWIFPDSTPFAGVTQTSTLAYTGDAVSVGGEWMPIAHAALAAYGRFGGTAHLRVSDTLAATGPHAGSPGLRDSLRRHQGDRPRGCLGERRVDVRCVGLGSASLGVHDTREGVDRRRTAWPAAGRFARIRAPWRLAAHVAV